MISLLVAMDKNRLIGKDNDLPWRLPADLAYFKKITMGHSIVMGRKTYESIGRPLPGRENIIVSRNKDYEAPGCKVINTTEEILQLEAEQEHKELFVIGGAEIFTEVLPFANKLYITMIDEIFDGDTFFPEVGKEEWMLISEEQGIKDDKNPYLYYFQVFERK
jgi:dihydrofolate reductase